MSFQIEHRGFSTKTEERQKELNALSIKIRHILQNKIPIFHKHYFSEKKSMGQLTTQLQWTQFLKYFNYKSDEDHVIYVKFVI